MKLDSSTLIFSIGILSLLMAFITWTFQGAILERNYGLKTWSVGISCVGISLILNFLRGELPPLFGILGANISLMAGGTLGLFSVGVSEHLPENKLLETIQLADTACTRPSKAVATK